MAIYYNHLEKCFKTTKSVFTSQYYINLGADVDKIIQDYLDDLNNICNCDSCKSFSFVFKNYCRNKIIEVSEKEKKLYLD